MAVAGNYRVEHVCYISYMCLLLSQICVCYHHTIVIISHMCVLLSYNCTKYLGSIAVTHKQTSLYVLSKCIDQFLFVSIWYRCHTLKTVQNVINFHEMRKRRIIIEKCVFVVMLKVIYQPTNSKIRYMKPKQNKKQKT